MSYRKGGILAEIQTRTEGEIEEVKFPKTSNEAWGFLIRTIELMARQKAMMAIAVQSSMVSPTWMFTTTPDYVPRDREKERQRRLAKAAHNA